MMSRASRWLLFVPCLSTLACGSGGGAAGGPVVPTTKDEILGGLGISQTTSMTTEVIDGSGGVHTIDTSRWQPLNKPTAVFGPRAEVFEVGAPAIVAGSQVHSALWEDGAATPSFGASRPLLDADERALVQDGVARAAVAADVDGDGIDEIVLIYTKAADPGIYYRISAGGVFGVESALPGLTHSAQSSGRYLDSRGFWFPYFSAGRGDLDDSGRDSVILVDFDTVYLLEATPAMGTWSLTCDATRGRAQFPTAVSSVATGDMDGDGRDELAVGLIDEWALFRTDLATPIVPPTVVDHASSPIEVTFGDFRGAHLKELVVAAFLTDLNKGVAMIYDYGDAGSGLSSPVVTINAGTTRLNGVRFLPRAVFLPNASGTDSLEIMGNVYYSPLQANTDSVPDVALLDYHQVSPFNLSLVDVQVGDVDNDGAQELVVLTKGLLSGWNMAAYGFDGTSPPGLVRKGQYSTDTSTETGDYYGNGATVAVGNFEDNSPRVQYRGHVLTYTDPIVVAVLVAPPFWRSLEEENAAYHESLPHWVTSFTESRSSGSSSGHSAGFSVGFSVEYEHEVKTPIFGLPITKFKASAAFKSTNKWEWSDSTMLRKDETFTASAGEDKVVFTAVPMDQYEYTILSTNDPVNNPAGKSLFITIPRAFNYYKVPVAFFNEHINPDMTAPIDDVALNHHVIGDPLSYPTVADKDSLLAAAFTRDGKVDADLVSFYQNGSVDTSGLPSPNGTEVCLTTVVDIGTGLAIAVDNEHEDTSTHDFSLDLSATVGHLDWSVTVEAGLEIGYSATYTSGTGTVYAGTIGCIPVTYAGTKYEYSSGLFAYPYTNKFGKNYWILNYWVVPNGR